jgi:hypothetical protein
MSEDIEEQAPLPPAALSAPVVLVEDSVCFHRALDDLLEA